MLRYSLLPAVACAMLAALLAPPPCFAQPKSPYIWPGGPPNDPNWIMIGVWYQSYSTTRLNQYQSIGLTSYICPTTPTSTDLANLRNRGFKLFTDQKSSLLTITNGGTIAGWNQVDEPDNAQLDPNYSQTVYGPCIDPNIIVARYNAMKAADPNRPVYLGLGQGVCWPITQQYYGRGSGATWSQYPIYCQGGDIICFDVYPYNARTTDPTYRKPWYVAIGVDRLRSWTNYSKPIWVHIETTHISGSGPGGPKPYQTVAEVWMAMIHGAVGVDYFVHSWVDGFTEPGIFSTDPNVVDPNMPGEVAALNARLKKYAPLFYSPTWKSYTDPNLFMNYMVKSDRLTTTIFSVGMRDDPNLLTGTISIPDMPASMTVTVEDEGRTRTMTNGSFTDTFPSLAVHIYTVPMPVPATKWNRTASNWDDPNAWTARDPNDYLRAIISNGGTATISKPGKPYSLFLIEGLNAGQFGGINMTGGWLRTSMAYVGYDGNGLFTQSAGDHLVDGNLYLAQSFGSYGKYVLGDGNVMVSFNEYLGVRGRSSFTQTGGRHLVKSDLYLGLDANGIAAYLLQDGNLTVSRNEYVGLAGSGSFTQTGGRHRVDGNLFVGSATGGRSAYTLGGGTLTLGGRLRIGATGTVFLQDGTLAHLSGDAGRITIESDGNLRIVSGSYTVGSVSGYDPNILRGATVLDAGAALNVTKIKQQSVSIGQNAELTLRGASRTTSVVNTLAIAGAPDAWTGTLDIKGNYLIVKGGSAATIENQVRSGLNLAGGYWDGKGITSSLAAADTNFYTSVGVLDNSLAHYTTFGDVGGLTGSEVLIRYTFYGDADLNGVVDFDTDYILWQEGFLNGYEGWHYGDFNHDGVVDFDNDYILWQTLFLNQPSLPAGAEAVPEPATLALLALGAAATWLGRRSAGRPRPFAKRV